jgi:hypothetical protein
VAAVAGHLAMARQKTDAAQRALSEVNASA